MKKVITRRQFGVVAATAAATLVPSQAHAKLGDNYPYDLDLSADCLRTLIILGDSLMLNDLFGTTVSSKSLYTLIGDNIGKIVDVKAKSHLLRFQDSIDRTEKILHFYEKIPDEWKGHGPIKPKDRAEVMHREETITLPFLTAKEKDRKLIYGIAQDNAGTDAFQATLGRRTLKEIYTLSNKRRTGGPNSGSFNLVELYWLRQLKDAKFFKRGLLPGEVTTDSANGKCCGGDGCTGVDAKVGDYCEEVAPGECSAVSDACQ